MNERSQLPNVLYKHLGTLTQRLDEMTIDPRCDDYSGREIARAVRILVNTLIGESDPRRTRNQDQLEAHLASHESTDERDYDLSRVPPNLAKLLNQAFIRLGNETMNQQHLGNNTEAAMYGGMAVAFKAVSTILEGGVEASPATIAVEVWAGKRKASYKTVMRSVTYFWKKLTSRSGAEPPFTEEDA
jgi:hypothetical protein